LDQTTIGQNGGMELEDDEHQLLWEAMQYYTPK
jgi:hypothetical protein